jgi:hypothetical protein
MSNPRTLHQEDWFPVLDSLQAQSTRFHNLYNDRIPKTQKSDYSLKHTVLGSIYIHTRLGKRIREITVAFVKQVALHLTSYRTESMMPSEDIFFLYRESIYWNNKAVEQSMTIRNVFTYHKSDLLRALRSESDLAIISQQNLTPQTLHRAGSLHENITPT